MRVFLLAAAALLLSACVSDGYRYHDEGYWSARARPSASIVVYDSCFGSLSYGYGPSWHAWHPCAGYAYGPYFGYGGFYALYDPFWPYSHRWPRHWHGHGSHGQQASSGERAYYETRRMGTSIGNTSERTFTRYEDLGPLRRRDLGPGGGGASNRSYGEGYAPSYSSGLSGNARGYAGSGRSQGLGSSRGNSSSASGMSSSRGSASGSGGSRASSSSSSSRDAASSSRSSRSEE